MSSVILAYFAFLPAYPSIIVFGAINSPGPALLWALIGIVALVIAQRRAPVLAKPWFVLWFMPGTIICGAAGVTPWPMALDYFRRSTGCATAASLCLCAAFNAALVYGAAGAATWWRRRRAGAGRTGPGHDAGRPADR